MSTKRPEVANNLTRSSNVRMGTASSKTSRQVGQASAGGGVLTPWSGIGMDGGRQTDGRGGWRDESIGMLQHQEGIAKGGEGCFFTHSLTFGRLSGFSSV